MGARRNFSRGGAKPRGLTKWHIFRRERKFSRFSRRFRLNLGVVDASAEGASENFRVFSTGTAYDVIIFKIQGGQLPQVAPLRAPMHTTCWYYSKDAGRVLVLFPKCRAPDMYISWAYDEHANEHKWHTVCIYTRVTYNSVWVPILNVPQC